MSDGIKVLYILTIKKQGREGILYNDGEKFEWISRDQTARHRGREGGKKAEGWKKENIKI
jgi:hypothetical protein